MDLFGFGLKKEGKGIAKDLPEKNGFFLFFEIFRRKLKKFFQLNMLYFLLSIPYLILLFFISTKVISFSGLLSSYVKQQQIIGLDTILRLFFVITIYIFWGAGPITAGFVYIQRNYAREEHAWLLSDFFEKTKENIKYGLIIMVLDLIVFSGGLTSIRFYMMQSANSVLFMIPQVILLILLLLYTIMHTYMYQLLVTFKLSFSELIKNAFLMAILKFPMNLLLTITIVGIMLAFMYIFPSVLLLVIPFIFISFTSFILNFYATNMIKRNFIDPYEEKEEISTIFDE